MTRPTITHIYVHDHHLVRPNQPNPPTCMIQTTKPSPCATPVLGCSTSRTNNPEGYEINLRIEIAILDYYKHIYSRLFFHLISCFRVLFLNVYFWQRFLEYISNPEDYVWKGKSRSKAHLKWRQWHKLHIKKNLLRSCNGQGKRKGRC